MGADDHDPTPVHETISGVRLVTIPLAHYAELLHCRRLATADGAAAPPKRKLGPRPSTLDEADPEVAAFARARFAAGEAIERVERACRRLYPGRASYQKLRSLWHKVRAEPGPM